MKKFILLMLLVGCWPTVDDLDIYYNEVVVNQIDYNTEIDSLYLEYGKYELTNSDINDIDELIRKIFEAQQDSLLNALDTLYHPINPNSYIPY